MNAALSTPLFSAIIPVFNKWDLTDACLHSLREHTPGDYYEVIVVDNGSSDATQTELAPLGEALFAKQFRHIRHEANKNFAPACNAGATLASARLLFFLNNDTLLTPHWAPPLLAALQKEPTPAAVGPLLLYADGTVQHLGIAFTPTGITHLYSGFPADHPVVGKPRRLQALTAAALMTPTSLFHEIGGFHEGYRNGFEDLELSLLLRRTGKKLVCVPESRIVHLESQSQGRGKNDADNARLLDSRHGNEFFIDIHHHGMRDGFAVTLDDFYGLSLLLPPEQETALLNQARQSQFRELPHLVGVNPYWIAGRELLAGLLESQGQFTQSCALRLDVTEIHPTLAAFQALAAIAIKAGNAALTAAAQKHTFAIKELRTHPDKARAVISTILNNARRHSDKFLIDLYTTAAATLK